MKTSIYRVLLNCCLVLLCCLSATAQVGVIQTTGLNVDQMGIIAWNTVNNTGPEPMNTGYNIPLANLCGPNDAFYYLASNDYDGIFPASLGSNVANTINLGFSNLQSLLTTNGYPLEDLHVKFGLMTLSSSTPMWYMNTNTELRTYSGGTYTIYYGQEPIISGPMPGLTMTRAYNNNSDCNDDVYSAVTLTTLNTDIVNISAGTSPLAQQVAAAFMADVGTNTGLRLNFPSLQLSDPGQFSDASRAGEVLESSVGYIELHQLSDLPPCDLGLSFTTTPPACAGDASGDINVSSTTGPLVYNWSTGATTQDLFGVPAGTYSVTATDPSDDSCFEVLDITLADGTEFDGTAFFSTDSLCFGDSVFVTVQPSNSVFDVSDAANPASPIVTMSSSSGTFLYPTSTTTYVVSIYQPGSNCFSTDTVTVIVADCPPACDLQVEYVDYPTSCPDGSDGSIELYPSAPSTYLWNDGNTDQFRYGLSAGTYTVTVTESGTGCTEVLAITVVDGSEFSASVFVFPDSICLGDSTNIYFNGYDVEIRTTANPGTIIYQSSGSGASNAWFYPTTTTTYIVDISDPSSGCGATDTLIVQVTDCDPDPCMGFDAQAYLTVPSSDCDTALICVQFFNGSGNYGATVTGPNGAVINPVGVTNPYCFQPFDGPGTYSIVAYDANSADCTATAAVSVAFPSCCDMSFVASSVGECEADYDLCIDVIGGAAPYTIHIKDGMGASVASITTFSPSICFDDLPVGGYVVEVTDGDNCFDIQDYSHSGGSVSALTGQLVTSVTCDSIYFTFDVTVSDPAGTASPFLSQLLHDGSVVASSFDAVAPIGSTYTWTVSLASPRDPMGGIYNGQLIVADANGCIDTFVVQADLPPCDDQPTGCDTYCDVVWADLVNTAVGSGNQLKKVSGGSSPYNGGAASTDVLPAGQDGCYRFRTSLDNGRLFSGLSTVNTDETNGTIDYAFSINNNGTFNIFEGGANLGNFGPFTTGDLFEVRRVGTTIAYYRNGSLVYTSATPSTTQLVVDVSIRTVGATIDDAKHSWGCQDPCPDVVAFTASDTLICEGDSVVLSIALSAGSVGSSQTTVQWYADGTFIGSGNSITAGPTVDGNCGPDTIEYTYEYYCDDVLQATGSIEVTVFKPVTASIFYPGSDFCTVGVITDCPGSYTVTWVDNFGVTGSGDSYSGTAGASGFVTFTITNSDAPDACNSLVVSADYSCPPDQGSDEKCDVVWTDLVNTAVAADNTLTKVSGGSSPFNGGAASQDVLPSGQDGCFTFEAAQNNAKLYVGVSTTNASATQTTIGYAIFLNSNGTFNIFESGSNKGNFGAYSPGDKFEIKRVSGVVTYAHNGVVVYTSTLAATSTWVVDVSIRTVGAAVDNAQHSWGCEQPCPQVVSAFASPDILCESETTVLTVDLTAYDATATAISVEWYANSVATIPFATGQVVSVTPVLADPCQPETFVYFYRVLCDSVEIGSGSVSVEVYPEITGSIIGASGSDDFCDLELIIDCPGNYDVTWVDNFGVSGSGLVYNGAPATSGFVTFTVINLDAPADLKCATATFVSDFFCNDDPCGDYGYYFDDATIDCTTPTVCLPLMVDCPVDSGIQGLDFCVEYDPSVMRPTGHYQLGSVVTSGGTGAASLYVDALNPGELQVGIFYTSGFGSYLQGAGEVICVEFEILSGIYAADFNIGECDATLIETYEPSVNPAIDVVRAVADGKLTVDMGTADVHNGRLIYRDDVTNPIVDDGSIVTNIDGADANCLGDAAIMASPHSNLTDPASALGRFSMSVGAGESSVIIDRDIPAANNVMPVINGFDGFKTWEIITDQIDPTIFELIAADANRSGIITSGDRTLILQRAAMMITAFPNGSRDWYFVDDETLATTDYKTVIDGGIADRMNVPTPEQCLPLLINQCGVYANEYYYGILLGDVDGNWSYTTDAATAKVAGEIIIDAAAAEAMPEGGYRVPVRLAANYTVHAIDLEVAFGGLLTGAEQAQALAGTNTEMYANVAEAQLYLSSTVTAGVEGTETPEVYYLYVSDLNALTFGDGRGYLNGNEVTLTVINNSTVSTQTPMLGEDLEVFPNPFRDVLTIRYTGMASEIAQLQLYDLNGKLVREIAPSTGHSTQIDLSDLTAGVYLLRVNGIESYRVVKL